MKKLKAVLVCFLILALQGDFVAHLGRSIQNALPGWLLLYRAYAASTFYVATDGDDSRSCATAQNIATPKRNISGASGALTCVTPANADIINVRGGTYTGNSNRISSSLVTIPDGTSWANALTIKAYNSETVILNITSFGAISLENERYLIFQDLIVDGTGHDSSTDSGIWCGTTSPGVIPNSDHVRLTNVTVRNWPNNATEPHCDFFEWNGGGVHDISGKDNYAAYITGSDSIFEHLTIYNVTGFGLHNNCVSCGSDLPDRNIFRFNKIYQTGTNNINSPAAILLGTGAGLAAYSNIVYGNTHTGIQIGGGATNAKVYGNTVIGGQYGIMWGIQTSTIIRNNAIYGASIANWSDGGFGAQPIPTRSDNACGVAGGSTTGCSITPTFSAARFADSANNDYRLCTGVGVPHASCAGASPLIGAGANLGAPYGIAFDGTTRIAPWSIGAYESTGPTCPSTPALVAQYGLNGSAVDSSGNGNNGSEGSGVTYTTGKYGQAASFAGTGPITVPDSQSLWICTGFTIAAWIKPSNTPTQYVAVARKGIPYFLYSSSFFDCPSGVPLAGYSQGGNVFVCGPAGFTINTWAHYGVTYDGSNLRMYINGVNVTTQAATATLDRDTDALRIGGSQFGEYFQGQIDELRIYNYARSGAQMIADMNTPIDTLTAAVTFKFGAVTQKFGAVTEKIGLAQ